MSELSRVTLTIPKKLWQDVKRLAPAGQRSRLVTEALEAEIRRRKRLENLEQLRQLQETMRQKYGELPSSADEIAQIRQERDDYLAGLHLPGSAQHQPARRDTG